MLTRRDFIKAIAGGAALLSVGAMTVLSVRSDGEYQGFCQYCEKRCGVLLTVKDGKVAEVKGDPNCDVHKGVLCAKARMLPDAAFQF